MTSLISVNATIAAASAASISCRDGPERGGDAVVAELFDVVFGFLEVVVVANNSLALLVQRDPHAGQLNPPPVLPSSASSINASSSV